MFLALFLIVMVKKRSNATKFITKNDLTLEKQTFLLVLTYFYDFTRRGLFRFPNKNCQGSQGMLAKK